MLEKVEKIEIFKEDGQKLFLTGAITGEKESWVTISTIRGETFHFRTTQIIQRKELSTEELAEEYQRLQTIYEEGRWK